MGKKMKPSERNIILNVYTYFQEEKKKKVAITPIEFEDVIQMKFTERCKQTNNRTVPYETIVPTEVEHKLLYKIQEYQIFLKYFDHVLKRVTAATGVSKGSVNRIKNQANKEEAQTASALPKPGSSRACEPLTETSPQSPLPLLMQSPPSLSLEPPQPPLSSQPLLKPLKQGPPSIQHSPSMPSQSLLQSPPPSLPSRPKSPSLPQMALPLLKRSQNSIVRLAQFSLPPVDGHNSTLVYDDSEPLKKLKKLNKEDEAKNVANPEKIFVEQDVKQEPGTSKVEIKLELDEETVGNPLCEDQDPIQLPVRVKTEFDEEGEEEEQEEEMEVAIFQGVDTTGAFSVDIVASGAWKPNKNSHSKKPRADL